jgi:hypothetical protein
MMPFTIRFEGLICHISQDEAQPDKKSHAALIADPLTHTPTLQISNLPPMVLDDGDTITFSTGAGTAVASDLFMQRVPHLRPLTPDDKTIQPKVLNHEHDAADKVLAFVIFPDGALDAPETAEHPVQFLKPNGHFHAKHCVSSGVLFTSAADAQLRVIRQGVPQDPIDLPSGTQLRIFNISDGLEGHFGLYAGITTSTTIGDATADTLATCPPLGGLPAGAVVFSAKRDALITGAMTRAKLSSSTAEKPVRPLTAPHAECTNSNWP